MNALNIALVVLYVIGVFVVGVGAWKKEFHDHMGDPMMASMGLLLSAMMGLGWPVLLAATPFVVAMHSIGKWIVGRSNTG